MKLKFHMQHDHTVGLLTCKSQPGGESKMAADSKNSHTIKVYFFSRMAWYIWLKFLCSIGGTLVFSDIKMKKKTAAELGHSDGLKIYIWLLSPFRWLIL